MNPVTLSLAQALLKDSDIESFLFDMNASVLDEDADEARKILEAGGLGDELMSL